MSKDFESLSDELKATLKRCTTEEELEKALADAGLQLDDDLLKAISGGIGGIVLPTCPGNMCRTDKCHDVMFAQNNALADGLASADNLAAICRKDGCVKACPVNVY